MNISIDGLRRSATADVNGLHESLMDAFNECGIDDHYRTDIEECFNKVAQSVGIFNCVFIDDIEGDFNDLTEELTVKFMDEFE